MSKFYALFNRNDKSLEWLWGKHTIGEEVCGSLQVMSILLFAYLVVGALHHRDTLTVD